MTYAVWDESLETGNALVDDQHKQLFALINELHDSIIEGDALETQQSVLARLMDYSEQHFQAEEGLMGSVGYPGLIAQQEMHREFTFKTTEMVEESRGDQPVLPITLAVFLSDWLTHHIRAEDKKIGEWIRGQGL
jgi:hemerythrin